MNSIICESCDVQDSALREARTARSNYPVFYTGLWHLLLELLSGPARRLHRLRGLGARMLEDRLRAQERRRCP